MIGTIVTTVSSAALVGEVKILQTAENGRVKYSFSVLAMDPFARDKEPKPSIFEAHFWGSAKLQQYLTAGKHVSLVGSLGRYQGPTRASVQVGALETTTDLEQARALRDTVRAQGEYPECGIVSTRTETGTTYTIWSEVVDRQWIEVNQLTLGADSYDAIVADKQAEINNLNKLVGDLQAQLGEFSPAPAGLAPELLEALAKAAKGNKGDMQQAIAALLASQQPATAPAQTVEAVAVAA